MVLRRRGEHAADSATMSLDGFIAGAGGDMSWLTAYVGGASPASEPDSGLDVEG